MALAGVRDMTITEEMIRTSSQITCGFGIATAFNNSASFSAWLTLLGGAVYIMLTLAHCAAIARQK